MTHYSPDILNCLANLSSDEVFTSPELANRMLDLLPQELFRSSKTRFLDPCSKSGVFLREIAKRLLAGLEEQIPDLQQRIDHIMTKQVFGIACTDLTAEMSRRTLYCTKQANGKYSVSTAFHDVQGNLRYDRCRHTWNAQGRCEHCGASQGEYLRADSRETYAYPFIHKPIKEIFNKDMQFDVIIGNPPYQLSTMGSKSQAIPLYDKFIDQSKKLNPRYLIMIIPDRWFSGGFGLDSFRREMLNDKRIRVIYDYLLASDCLHGFDIHEVICYFLINRDSPGLCDVYINNEGKVSYAKRPLLEEKCDVFVKYNEAIPILRKVLHQNESTFDTIVSSQKPFGLSTTFEGEHIKKDQMLMVYGRNQNVSYINKNAIKSNISMVESYKVFIGAAYGERISSNYLVIGNPFIGEPNSICTETYVAIGQFKSRNEAENVISYMISKFFRFMVFIRKPTQHLLKSVYKFVPLQDFSHPWTDEMLYEKYGLDKDEIAFIESMIRPME